MCKYFFIFITLFFLILSSLGYSDSLYSNEQRDAVEKILRNQVRRDWSKLPAQEHAEDLKSLGDKALPILASFLTDYNFGYDASETMLAIDANKAAPLIFASMPQSDRNVQYHTFKYFIRQIQNHQPVGFLVEMHDAAVRCLEAETNADAAEEDLLAIGLTGSQKDFVILEEYYNNKHQTEVWRKKLQNASEAALARLGNEKYLIKIMNELNSPVPKVLTLEKGIMISDTIQKASFTGNQKFIPLLCQHLDDPAVRESDFGVMPAYDAAQALNQIGNQSSPDSKASSIDDWKKKCLLRMFI